MSGKKQSKKTIFVNGQRQDGPVEVKKLSADKRLELARAIEAKQKQGK